MAEEYVEVDIDEVEAIGSPKTPNKDTNTERALSDYRIEEPMIL